MTKPLLNASWISRLEGFSKLIVGFSGGLDSTVLLRLLAEQTALHGKIVAVHVNHGISKHAMQWQDHCQQVCLESGVDFISKTVSFDRTANIEEGARIARYQVFTSLLTAQDCLVLGHHLNDQAETLLLQLFRGAGVDGLAAMLEFSPFALGALARPLLSFSREQLEQYAHLNQLTWVEDESNKDVSFSRNYLRQNVMPLLADKWPAVVNNLARTASHCQQARSNLEDLAYLDAKDLSVATSTLSIESIKDLNFERISNVLRVWLKKNQVSLPSTLTFQRLIHEVIWASPDAMPIVDWDNVRIRRYSNTLYLENSISTLPAECPRSTEWIDFPSPLMLPNKISVTAHKAKQGLLIPSNAKLEVKFRQGGEELCLHGQTRKLKKLFQEWGVEPWMRAKTPLIYINDQLAAVVGYAVSDRYYAEEQEGIWDIIM